MESVFFLFKFKLLKDILNILSLLKEKNIPKINKKPCAINVATASHVIVTFSKGPIGLLKMTDMWISNLIYSVGLDKYFSSIVPFSAAEFSEIKDNYNRLYKEGKINVDSFIYDVYDYLERFLESDIIVELEDKEENITKGMLENYELDKTYSFDKEVIKEKVEYITTGVVAADEINMIVNDKSVSAKNIIKELYEEYEGLSFDYLDGFMRYLNNLTMNPMLRRAN